MSKDIKTTKKKAANSGAQRQEKVLLDIVEKSVARMEAYSELESPLTFLLKLYNDPNTDPKLAEKAANDLLPYMHNRKAKRIESEVTTTTNVNVKVTHERALESLDELLDMKPLDDLSKEINKNKNEALDGEFIEKE